MVTRPQRGAVDIAGVEIGPPGSRPLRRRAARVVARRAALRRRSGAPRVRARIAPAHARQLLLRLARPHRHDPAHDGGGRRVPGGRLLPRRGARRADPRKGLWHPAIATIATLAHADPLDAWWTLAALLAALFVLNAAAFAFLVGGSSAAAVGAWALVLTYGGSLAVAVPARGRVRDQARRPARARHRDGGARGPRSRDARTPARRVGLALGAVATHVFAALQFGDRVRRAWRGAAGARSRGAGRVLRRLVVTSLALGLACLPYLLWRAHSLVRARTTSSTPSPRGCCTLAPGVTVVSVGVLWDWFGLLWVVFPLSRSGRGRAHASRHAGAHLLTTTLAVALLLFCPPVVAVLEPRLGYLLMRFVWLLPLSGALAFAMPSLLRAIRIGRAARPVPVALAACAGLGLLLAPVARRRGRMSWCTRGPSGSRRFLERAALAGRARVDGRPTCPRAPSCSRTRRRPTRFP